MSDFDNPWKEALEQFLSPFLAFFFPEAFAGIDWKRGYESLDKELQQIIRDAESGPRLADKLFKVWRLDGEEAWVLVHVEVQNRAEDNFSERMYTYNYRIYDRYRRPVVSLAVLGDDRRQWHPTQYGYELWGCNIRFQFPSVKLLEYASDVEALIVNPNPFAAVTLAHIKTMETRRQPELRRDWKLRLVKSLFERGLRAAQIRQLFRVIDWMMDLPKELEREFITEVHRFEEEKKMPYVTSIERIAREEGFEQGLKQGLEQRLEQGREQGRQEGEVLGLRAGISVVLEVKFGEEGLAFASQLESVNDIDRLRSLKEDLRTTKGLDELKSFFK